MQGLLLAERFRIGERLGSGGMGEVWAAQDERMRRDVAVKLVHAVFGTREAETRARFRREVQLAGRLSHQNIVTVHDWGEVAVGGRPVFYLVMELVHGVSLGKRLTAGVPAWPVAVGWGIQVAHGLDAAHRQGVVHRDIKPANMLLTPEGTVKVLDFGVAKFMGETMSAHELTATGALLGSPPYMSPEQAEGAREIDHRSDLYSLGCLLYHAVTGRPPFVSDSPLAVLRMQMDDLPVAPGELVVGLPWAVNDLVLSLLAKDPEDRPADAAAVYDTLCTVLVEQAVVLGGSRILEAAQLGYGGVVAERILEKTLDMWRDVADRREGVEAEAEEVLRNARADAEDMYADAYAKQREAERILKDAEEEALRVREEAERVRVAEVARTAAVDADAVRELIRAFTRSEPQDAPDVFAGFALARRGYDREKVDERIARLVADRDGVLARLTALELRAEEIVAEQRAGGSPEAVQRESMDIIASAFRQTEAEYTARRNRSPQVADLTPFGFELVRRGYDRAQVDERIRALEGDRERGLMRIGALEKAIEGLHVHFLAK